MHPSVTVRSASPGDYDAIIAVVDQWWGRPMTGALQRLFLDHFWPTSLIAETRTDDGRAVLAGFLVGFASQADAQTAYIHFVGVAPSERGTGLGRHLYQLFFDLTRADGRYVVHAVTGSANIASIGFHRALGFEAHGPIPDYDGPGADRVCFAITLE